MVHDLARTSSRVEKKDERYWAFNVAPLREYKIKLKDEFSYDQMLIIDLIDRQIVAISDERFSNVPPYLWWEAYVVIGAKCILEECLKNEHFKTLLLATIQRKAGNV